MLSTSERLLRVLTLLESRRDWSGADLAERLEVSTRTIRNDRGRGGGNRGDVSPCAGEARAGPPPAAAPQGHRAAGLHGRGHLFRGADRRATASVHDRGGVSRRRSAAYRLSQVRRNRKHAFGRALPHGPPGSTVVPGGLGQRPARLAHVPRRPPAASQPERAPLHAARAARRRHRGVREAKRALSTDDAQRSSCGARFGGGHHRAGAARNRRRAGRRQLVRRPREREHYRDACALPGHDGRRFHRDRAARTGGATAQVVRAVHGSGGDWLITICGRFWGYRMAPDAPFAPECGTASALDGVDPGEPDHHPDHHQEEADLDPERHPDQPARSPRALAAVLAVGGVRNQLLAAFVTRNLNRHLLQVCNRGQVDLQEEMSPADVVLLMGSVPERISDLVYGLDENRLRYGHGPAFPTLGGLIGHLLDSGSKVDALLRHAHLDGLATADVRATIDPAQEDEELGRPLQEAIEDFARIRRRTVDLMPGWGKTEWDRSLREPRGGEITLLPVSQMFPPPQISHTAHRRTL